MEFLPMEKYSIGRKTAKHKKDVKILKKKSAIKEAKSQRKAKTVKSANYREKKAAGSKTEKRNSESDEEEKEIDEEIATPPVKAKTVANNRLFVNMKKKILNIQEVKDLHPDIVSITLPRKKNSSWCWAVFESKKKAVNALKVMKKRKDIIVNQMMTEELKKEKKAKNTERVKIKRTMKKALKAAWM